MAQIKKQRVKAPPKTIPNPEYSAFVKEQMRDSAFSYPDEDMYPEEYNKKLPEDGGWILLLTSVKVGKQIDNGSIQHIDIPHLSAWFAMPYYLERESLYQAVLQTPEGAVHVWPHEYQLFNLERFLDFTDEDGFEIHFLNESNGFDEAAMFYIRSRGISKADAQRMLLPALKDPNYCYFTFSDELREYFPEGTGMMLPFRGGRAWSIE